MAKIVINRCYGGFGVSKNGTLEILRRKGLFVVADNSEEFGYSYLASDGNEYHNFYFEDKRDDPELISAIEELGSEFMSSKSANLAIAEYDEENFTYSIDEYDGYESLVPVPFVSEKKLSECKGVEEIMNYIESLGIKVVRNS